MKTILNLSNKIVVVILLCVSTGYAETNHPTLSALEQEADEHAWLQTSLYEHQSIVFSGAYEVTLPYAGTFEKHIPYLQAGLSWLPTRFADHTVGPWAGKVTVDDMTYTNWLSIAGIEDDPLMWGKADIEAGLNALQWTVYRSTYAATCSNRVTVSGGYDWADAIVRQKEFWSDSEWCFNYDNSPIYGASARTFGSSFTPFAGAGRTKSHSMIGCATNVPCSIDIYYYMTGVNENEFHDFDGLGAEYGKLLLFETLPMEFPVLISSGRGIREGNMIGDYESNPMDLVTLSTTECDAKGIEASSMEAVLKWGFTPK